MFAMVASTVFTLTLRGLRGLRGRIVPSERRLFSRRFAAVPAAAWSGTRTPCVRFPRTRLPPAAATATVVTATRTCDSAPRFPCACSLEHSSWHSSLCSSWHSRRAPRIALGRYRQLRQVLRIREVLRGDARALTGGTQSRVQRRGPGARGQPPLDEHIALDDRVLRLDQAHRLRQRHDCW